MWPTAHMPSYVHRPRPLQAKNRHAQAVEQTSPVDPVALHLKDRFQDPSGNPDDVTVEQIMESQVIAVPPGLRLRELGRLFVEKKMSGFPVVDASGELLGLVSQRDLVQSMVDQESPEPESFSTTVYTEFPEQFGIMPGGCVADIMTPYVYYATPDTPIQEVIDLMLERGIHRVLVTERGRLRGMVTTSKLLRVLRDILD